MFKKVAFYLLTIILPWLGSGIDLIREKLVALNTGNFTLGRWILFFDAVVAILFAAVIVWLAVQLRGMNVPKPAGAAFILYGVLILCFPILYVSGFAPGNFAHVFFDSYQWHLFLAGAMVSVLGVGSLLIHSQKKDA